MRRFLCATSSFSAGVNDARLVGQRPGSAKAQALLVESFYAGGHVAVRAKQGIGGALHCAFWASNPCALLLTPHKPTIPTRRTRVPFSDGAIELGRRRPPGDDGRARAARGGAVIPARRQKPCRKSTLKHERGRKCGRVGFGSPRKGGVIARYLRDWGWREARFVCPVWRCGGVVPGP